MAPDDVNGTIVAHDDANVINESGLEFPLNTSNNVLSEISHQNNVLPGICNKDNSVSRQDHQVDISRETNYQMHKGNMYGMSEQSNFLNTKARQTNKAMIKDEKNRLHEDITRKRENLPQELLPDFSFSLPKSSSTSTAVREELVATGLELPENGGIDKNLGTVTDDLENLMEKNIIHLPEVDQAIDVQHLKKDVQHKIRRIETQYKDSFSTTGRLTGGFFGFLYDIRHTFGEVG